MRQHSVRRIAHQHYLPTAKSPSTQRLPIIQNPLGRMLRHQSHDPPHNLIGLLKVFGAFRPITSRSPAFPQVPQLLLRDRNKSHDIQDPVLADGEDEEMFLRS